MTALPPDLREAVETVRGALTFDTGTVMARRHTKGHSALALIEQRLMEYRTALEMIRDRRSEGGSKLISGREAEAIASAALSASEGEKP